MKDVDDVLEHEPHEEIEFLDEDPEEEREDKDKTPKVT